MINREEAIRILDPKTTREALVEIEYRAGFNGQRAVMEAVNEACMMGAEALRNERPKGRWVETCMADVYQCSNCKKATKMDEFCDSDILRNFCPNCGADMRGEEG